MYPRTPADALDVHGVAARLGTGLRGATAWFKECPGITYKAGNRLQVQTSTFELWLAGDPEVRANAVRDYRAEAEAAKNPRTGYQLRAVAGGRP